MVVRIVVGSPGRLDEYKHLECHFDHEMPAFTPIPEVFPSPQKKARVENKAGWKQYRWTCNVKCSHCGGLGESEDAGRDSNEAATAERGTQGSRGSGRTTDPLLLLTDVDTTCGEACKFNCASVFPMEARLKVRKLRHEHYSTGMHNRIAQCA